MEFSVLLPLQEPRAVGEECLRAWTRGQTFPREQYEVLVVAPGNERTLERRARTLLTPLDRWLEHPMWNEWQLFNVGAAQARGRFLFFTEAHCVPHADCLVAMRDDLRTSGRVGAIGRSLGSASSGLGRLEMLVYEEALRVGEAPDHWRKVLIHSSAIRTDVFQTVGGFRPEYGDFSPWALAMALRERECRLGFTAASTVHHVYTGELGILAAHVRDFAQGEMRFWAYEGERLAARYLDEAREWTDRWACTRAGARAAFLGTLATRRLERGWMRAALGYAATWILRTWPWSARAIFRTSRWTGSWK